MVTITQYMRQQKRHWCTEHSVGLCGRGRGWDDLGEWHWNMYNIICETSLQSRFDARYWMLGAGALRRPRGMLRGGRREEGSGWGTHVYLWQIQVDIWQNQYNIVKLNNKIKIKKKKSLHQHHSSKASILWRSTFFIVQLWHPHMTTGKTIALTTWTFGGKVMSLLFNMLSRLVITFLPRSKCLLISWLQSSSAVILEPPKNKVSHCFHCFPIYFPWSDGTRCHDLSILNVEF